MSTETKRKISNFKLSHLPRLLLKTYHAWMEKEPFQISAIIAYYAILSLPGLLILILELVGGIWGKEIVQGELFAEISSAMGPETAQSIQEMIKDQGSQQTSLIATLLGIGVLIYGATGVFYQLQNALNEIWEAKPKYTNEFISTLFMRLKGFGFIIIIGFLLLVSFVLTSLLSAFSTQLSRLLPDGMLELGFVLDLILSLGFIYLLFGAMFKYLPSTHVRWKAVKVGAALTAVLFLLGKYALAFYFGKAEPGSTYGAAGSIILVMLWVSYSSLIVTFGAQFTKIYSDKYVKIS
ncbi:YihY/virulence factor BrkB family protein [Maribacter dokdonensis]|uniref:YihY/virulence factor BrkB family protein n=1 Tax=Maribacter dokdonensis TaxID=320912 RepID=UPI0027376B9C|nr:YihY/virulence factor BrkB family protein [Maribacter dokdonensis]MDP2526244.1 YihY/virulence factor BrkB family protein [Maribacter dokdonensis]|tara:strand:+ start:12416 stop:13297 length:882 start_codon:yes stop_codon:yes gene_type:complete